MRAFLLALLLVGCSDPEADAKRSVAYLTFTDGSFCSGTMIAPTILVTASHCLLAADLFTMDMRPVDVVGVAHDGNDIARIVLAEPVAQWAQTGPELKQGDQVFSFGNPGPLQDQLRRGYVTGISPDGIMIDMPVSGGDSGAAIFNEQGQAVAIISGFRLFPSGAALVVAKPL